MATPARGNRLSGRSWTVATHEQLPERTGGGPVEPPETPWDFPDPAEADVDDDVVCQGGDLQPGTLLAAYRRGLFPMPMPGLERMCWWSPVRRGVLPLDNLRVSRSLRRSAKRFHVTDRRGLRRRAAAVRHAAPPRFVDHRRSCRGLHRPPSARLGALGRGVGRQRGAGGRPVRSGRRRAVRGRVDVPRPARRLEGGSARPRGIAALGAIARRPAPRRAVVHAAPGLPWCGRDHQARVPATGSG